MTMDPYRKWLQKLAKKQGRSVNDLERDDYDYEVYYRGNPREAERMLNADADAGVHFPDTGKTPGHPTFSDESVYSGRRSAKNPTGMRGGHWEEDRSMGPNGWRYTLSEDQMRGGWDVDRTIDYLSDAEDEGVSVRMPDGTMPRTADGGMYGGVLPTLKVEGKRRGKGLIETAKEAR